MACDSKANALRFLKKKEVLGPTNEILDHAKFEKYNKELTRYAEIKYDLNFGNELLFSIYQSQVTDPRGSRYWRDNIIQTDRIVPNDEMFQSIDRRMIQIDIAEELGELEIQNLPDAEYENEIPDPFFKRGKFEANEVNKLFQNELKTKLVTFLGGLNIKTDLSADKLLDGIRYKKGNPLAAYDVIQKFLALKTDITDKTLLNQSAYIIYTMLGRGSKIHKDLWFNIESWSKYDDVYNKWDKISQENRDDAIFKKQLDFELLYLDDEVSPDELEWNRKNSKKNFWAHRQAILEFVAEMLEIGLDQKYIGPKRSNPDINKAYFEAKGHKDRYAKGALRRLINRVLNWIQENIYNNKAFDKYNEEDLKSLVLDVVDDVYQLKYEKFIRNYYLSEEDGNWYDMSGQLYEVKDYEKSISKDPFIADVIDKLFGNPFLDFGLSGSATLRKFGRVIRSVDEAFHDIDGDIKLEQFMSEKNAMYFLDWLNNRGLPLSRKIGKSIVQQRRDSKKFEKELIPFLEDQNWYQNIQNMFPTFKFLRAFIGKDHAQKGESITITGTIEHPTETELVTQENLNGRSPKDIGKQMPKLYTLDFFLRTKEGAYPRQYTGYQKFYKEWKEIFEAKVNMGRAKDLNDLIYFMPTVQDAEGYQFHKKGMRYFSFTNENQNDLTVDITNPFENEVSLMTAESEGTVDVNTIYKNDKVVGKIKYKTDENFIDVLEIDASETNAISTLKVLGQDAASQGKILKSSKNNRLFDILERQGYASKNDGIYYYVDPGMYEAVKSAIIEVPVDTKAINKARGQEIAQVLAKKLSLALNIGYANVSQADAKALLNAKGKPYNNEAAFYWGGTVYVVGDNINLDTVLHEFAHPFIKAIESENPDLFNNLYTSLESTTEGRYIINHVRMNYPELNITSSAFKNEALTYSLQYHAVNKVTEEVESKGYQSFMSKLLYAIRQMFKRIFNVSKVSDINESSTMEELADKLLNEQFDLQTKAVTNEDLIFYIRNIKEMASNLTENVNAQNLQRGINDIFVMNNLVLNKAFNYKAQTKEFQDRLDKVLFDDNQLSPKIKQMLRSYQTVTNFKNKSKEEIIKDVVRAEKERQRDLANSSRAFVNSIGVVDNIAKNIYNDLAALQKTGRFNSRDAVSLLYTYRNIINGYKSMFTDFDEYFTEDQGEGKPEFNVNEDNEFFTFMNNVKANLDRANKIISDIYKENNVDLYVETVSYMNEFLVNELKSNLFKSMKNKMRDEDIQEFFDKALANKLTNEDYEALKKKDIEPKYISRFVRKYNEFNLTRDKIADALSGKLGDVSFFNRYLESYTSSNDPIVGGLAIFIQNLRTESENSAIRESYEFRNKMAELLPKIGYNRLKTRQVLDIVATKDFTFSLRPVRDKNGNVERLEPVKKEIYSFHDKFGNGWRYDLGQLEYNLREAQESEDKDAIEKAEKELYDFNRQFMHDIYLPEVYELDKIYAKYPPQAAEAARQARKRALDSYNTEANEITDELERFQKYSTLQALWKDYQMLHSYTYENGKPKVDSPEDGVYDLSIAKILNEYRDASREFYEFTERPGSLQNAYDQFINMIDTQYGSESEEFEQARNEWIKQNTRIAQTQEYFDMKFKLINRLKELQEKMKTTSTVDVSALYKEMYDLIYSNKDSLNQPVPSELGVEKIRKIKTLQQKVIDFKATLDRTSGLSREESSRLKALIQVMKRNPEALTEDNKNEYIKLLQKQTSTGLSLAEANELESIYAELGDLSKRVATEYYVDTFNEFLTEMEIAPKTAEQLETFIESDELKGLLAENDEFSDWFFDNHVMYQVYQKGKRGKQTVYSKSIVNSISIPNNEDYFQKTELVDPLTKQKFTLEVNGIPVVGNARHSNYQIKSEYMTGYNSSTGEVELVVGEHIDNRGRFIPRYEQGSKYINTEYEKMQNRPSSPEYKLLQELKRFHLKYQEGIPDSSKLYLDLPRFILRDNLSMVQSGELGNRASQIKESFLQYFRDMGRGRDRSMDDYNFIYDDNTQEYRLVATTLEGEEIERIPVAGLFDIEINNTDPDVMRNMMRYLYSLEHQKALVETLPMVQSILETLEDPDNYLKKTRVYRKGVFQSSGKLEDVKEKKTYNRLGQVKSLIEREYYGRKFEGSFGSEVMDKVLSKLQKLSARGSLALNIPSDLKNRFGQLMQNYIEMAGGEYINTSDYARGRIWAASTMTKWLAKDVYSIGAGSLNYQLVEAFDSVFATKDKFGRTVTRSFVKDLLNGEWMYMARKNLEMEAALQLFGAFLNSKKIEQTLANGKTRTIRYVDAWELDPNTGVMRLKEGIDPEYNNKKIEHVYKEGESFESIANAYGISVKTLKDKNGIKSILELSDGDTLVIANMEKFKQFKNTFQGISRRLYGAYDEFGQSEGNKYSGFRLFTFMRKWFFPMFYNKWGFSYDSSRGGSWLSPERFQPRYDWATGTTPIGYYVNTYKALLKVLDRKAKGYQYLTLQEKIDSKKTLTDAMIIIIAGLVLALGFGYDPDDPDRFKKMKKKSGPLFTEDFNLKGYIENLTQILTLGTMQEVSAFIPMIQMGVYNFGLDDYQKLVTSTTSAFNNTIGLYMKILEDLYKMATGNPKAYYDKDVGELWYKQKGQPKIYNHLFRSIGITGGTQDLPESLKGIESSGKLR